MVFSSGRRGEKTMKHILISGMTRHGKTYYAKHCFKNGRGIFLNPRVENIPGSLRVDGTHSVKDIISAIKRGRRLNYILNSRLDYARKEVDLLCDYLLAENWTSPILVICDEIQDFSPQGDTKSGILRLARTGLGQNIQLVSICQRIADLSKIVVTQSEIKVFFRPADEDVRYLELKGYPVQEIKKRIADRKYYYCIYEGGELSLARKL